MLRAAGEVSERAELLNGFLQLALDGEASGDEAGERWRCSCALSWQLGRDGPVSLAEGDIALEDADGDQFAILEHGTSTSDPDTGSALVHASFTVDGVRGGWAAPGDRITCELAIDAEHWRGELRVRPA